MKPKVEINKEKNEAVVGQITLKLSPAYDDQSAWLGQELAAHQLKAAWLRFSDDDQPMNPRLVGKPGVGKTTLAVSVGRQMGAPVYLMQGTSDTRPDDLLITPIITEGRQISYVASPLITAMLVGGICILDEGNRMSEKSWASLASLLDHRRYVDSILAGVRIHAHPEFRFVTTMNDDASVFDLPEYIQSRLNPQIFLDFADPQTEARIIKQSVPYVEDDLLNFLVQFLTLGHQFDETFSVRDGIQIAKYAHRLRALNPTLPVAMALRAGVASVLGESALKYTDTLEREGKSDSSHLRPV